MASGLLERRIDETPVAIIDFETTGLTPGYDRVAELAVVRVDPGQGARLVLDTLVHPQRPMAATEIHGITDAAVAEAPRFVDVAGELLRLTEGCMIASYNVYFDIKFLITELNNAGVAHQPPHFCVMYLRPMLGVGSRCKLGEACAQHSIRYQFSHRAADDALAAGQLYDQLRTVANQQGVVSWDDLSRKKKYKFNESFSLAPLSAALGAGLPRLGKLVSRAGFQIAVDPLQEALASYWETLAMVLGDLSITDDELDLIRAERKRTQLRPDQIRTLHARAFASVIAQFTADQSIDDREVAKLRRLHKCLAQLGWAPGM
jgi:DNA polymerase III subunit epsilon